MSYATAAAAYKQNAILTASPEKLVVLLYDGAIRHLERSKLLLADPKSQKAAPAGEALGKAMAIVGELRSVLDRSAGGEIAGNLDSLYGFCTDQILAANLDRRTEPVDHALRVLRTLKEAWDAIVPH